MARVEGAPVLVGGLDELVAVGKALELAGKLDELVRVG